MSDAGEQQQLPVSPAFDDLLVDAGSRFLYPVLLFMSLGCAVAVICRSFCFKTLMRIFVR